MITALSLPVSHQNVLIVRTGGISPNMSLVSEVSLTPTYYYLLLHTPILSCPLYPCIRGAAAVEAADLSLTDDVLLCCDWSAYDVAIIYRLTIHDDGDDDDDDGLTAGEMNVNSALTKPVGEANLFSSLLPHFYTVFLIGSSCFEMLVGPWDCNQARSRGSVTASRAEWFCLQWWREAGHHCGAVI